MLANYYIFVDRLVFFVLGHLLASSAIYVKYCQGDMGKSACMLWVPVT